MRMLVGLSVLLGVASVSHADPISAPTCAPPAEKVLAPKTLRDVDWCNFDYGLWRGTMREGRSEVHLYAKLGQPHDTIAHHLRGVVYGGKLAAIVIEQSSWYAASNRGSSSSTVYVYELTKGVAKQVGTFPAGTPVREIVFGKGTIAVTSGPDTSIATMTFKRGKAGFVEVKPATP
jgi:hypothetical protein